MPPKGEKASYKKYKEAMKKKYPKFTHLPMTKHGHFIGAFHNALKHSRTKHFFMLQHDIKLVGEFPIDKCLDYTFDWNIIATHHMKNGLQRQHWFPIFKQKNKDLWKSWGWSERIFLSKRDWMMDQLYKCNVDEKRTIDFMDPIFQKEFQRKWKQQTGLSLSQKSLEAHKITDKEMKAYDKLWNEWKCFLLKSKVSYHVHLCGRTAENLKKKKTLKRGGGSNKKQFLEALEPKNMKDTCRKVCEQEKKQYPKKLEAQAKMLGNQIDKKKKAELMKKFEKQCPTTCARELKKISVIAQDPAFSQLVGKFEQMEKKKLKTKGGCGPRGGGGKKKRTVKKSKAKGGNNSAYFEFKSGSSRKFWRIVKKDTKITTHYGKLGSLGQMTTKDYGSKVDQEYDKLIQSKKKKGYVEKWDFGSPNPKKPTAIEREYMKICNKAERSKVLNPNQINSDCEAMLDQGESELKWMTGWYKDALKKGDFDWGKYNEHSKTKRRKKTKKKGGAKNKGRKGPEESATKYPVGTEKKGNDGNMWEINVSKKGIQRWVKKEDKSARGKNKPLEKLWTDMSNMRTLIFVFKDGSYKIHKIKRDDYEKKIDIGKNDPNVKAILTAGNSFDGYQQLYDRVKQSSVDQVLRDYKKYWKYKMDDKLYTC
jgi:predicted DNA-binding WGR domain protein